MAGSFLDNLLAGLRNGWEISRTEAFRLVPRSSMGTGWRNPFLTEKDREKRETKKLYDSVKALFDSSPFADSENEGRFYFDIVTEACDRADITPSDTLGEALFSLVAELVALEGTMYGFPTVNWDSEITIEEGVWLRGSLERRRRFIQESDRLLPLWRHKVVVILAGILGYLPDAATRAPDDEDENQAASLTVPLIDLCETPNVVIERVLVTIGDDDVVLPRLFEALRDQLDVNLTTASGISLDRADVPSNRYILPSKQVRKSPCELVKLYLQRTPFADLFNTPLPFHIPLPVRYEHTHIVGGTGHGKTQLMQLLIHEDLRAALEENRSLIIIDSQGDLINTIARLPYFARLSNETLADRLLVIDPNDVEYPVSLNMFDTQRERLGTLRPVDREKILNGTIDLYEYLFGAVLGAELTARQGMLFKYLARLMLQIPDATIHTFREIMENGERFKPYMAELPPTARAFFETRFFDRSFNETKKQILNRLWGVLSNATFDRMFSHKRNKVDLFEAMQSGKIVLINTAKELLKQDGCSIFGRFFIALIARAALERTVIAPHERNPTFVYIDEAHDYFDDSIDQLLIQARKYRIGLVLAHQTLDQLTPSLRASLMTNTSTKFVGGLSAKDASAFAQEMRTSPDFVHEMRKGKKSTQFACFVRNMTPHAVEVSIPLGHLEKLTPIDDWEHEVNLALNRELYAAPPDPIWEAPPREAEPAPQSAPSPKNARPAAPLPPIRPIADTLIELEPQTNEEATPEIQPAAKPETPPRQEPRAAPPQPKSPGRGGKQHKYLQEVIKQAGEECGYLATVEESILSGAGWVDVSLKRDDIRIACEISMTSTHDQELGNIEKCLAAGFTQVVLICATERRRTSLCKFIAPRLEESEVGRVQFYLAEEFLSKLFDSVSSSETKEETIRGYKVKSTQKKLSDEEAKARRDAIGKLLARSMRNSTGQ